MIEIGVVIFFVGCLAVVGCVKMSYEIHAAWILLSILMVICGLMICIGGSSGSDYSENLAMSKCGLIILGVYIPIMIVWLKTSPRQEMTRESYQNVLVDEMEWKYKENLSIADMGILAKKVIKLCNSSESRISAVHGGKHDILARRFNALATSYNQYSIALLGTGMYERKPMNSTTAAAIGTSLGGIGVGIAAGLNARENEIRVKENNAKVNSQHLNLQVCAMNMQMEYLNVLKLLQEYDLK